MPFDLGEGFALAPPMAEQVSERAHAPATPWEKLLAQIVADQREIVLTESMHCTARELGRFYLERKAMPANTLRRFVLGRCGAIAPDAMANAILHEVPDTVTEAALFESGHAQIEANVRRMLKGFRGSAGLWFGRAEGRITVMLVLAPRLAELAPFDRAPGPDGAVHLRGRALSPAGAVMAYVNRGLYGVAPCEMDLAVRPPEFAARCVPDLGDAETTIEILAVAPERVLARPIAQILARGNAHPATEFHSSPYGESAVVANSADFARELLRQLNVVRARASLHPVQLADKQSQTAERLAPHFLAAAQSDDVDGSGETIALGLLAGWEIDGLIRDGSFLFELVMPTHDVAQWLSAALSTPLGRLTLLEPSAERIAIGPLHIDDPAGLAASVTSYSFHHGDDHEQDIARLYDRIVRARELLGLTTPMRLGDLEEDMREELAQVHTGKAEPADALRNVMQQGVLEYSRAMGGYQIEVVNMAMVEIPDEVLRAKRLALEIGVTHHRPEGAAWAQYVILIVYADPGSET